MILNIYYIIGIKLKLGADKVNTIISSKKSNNSSTRFTLSSYQHTIKMMKVHIKVIIEFYFSGDINLNEMRTSDHFLRVTI